MSDPQSDPLAVIAALGEPESFQLLVESIRDYGIVMLSPDGVILTWTEGARRLPIDGLRRSNHDLEAFAAVASHDLQERRRKIQAFGERLSSRFGASLPEQGRDYLARLLASTQRMQHLIDALLAYSRIAHERRAFVPVSLDEVAAQVVSDLEVRIAQSNASVDVGPMPTIDADPVQMRQLLQILIANGLKFHRVGEPPSIRVRAVPDANAGACELSVEHDGIGFEPEYSERIFGVFQRLHGRTACEGTGVGLAVCRRIAERHGGRIVASGRPGLGARFTATLPLHHADQEERP